MSETYDEYDDVIPSYGSKLRQCVCAECGKKFTGNYSKNPQFCSRRCREAFYRRKFKPLKSCHGCEKIMEWDEPYFVFRFCSKACFTRHMKKIGYRDEDIAREIKEGRPQDQPEIGDTISREEWIRIRDRFYKREKEAGA
jgi:endogenous inhibitor of DNA gyrase (YacG/DUF329 family)